MSCSWIASPFILQPIKFPNNSKLTPLIKSRKTLTLICSTDQKDSRRNDGPKKPIRRNPRKRTYGASRRSVLKKSLIQEQVDFSGTISDDPVVAIIGGGMSGLVCALNLEKLGIRSTVFDTGIHGLGGRLGTRTIDHEPDPLTFDHAAQFFTVSDPKFAELTNEWFNKGLIRQWEGKIGNLDAENGQFVSIDSLAPRYIAVNGMRALADSILSQSRLIDVVRPCWISTLEPFNGMWHVSENGKPRGQFDAVVIAHNGKCANRLLSSSGLPLIARQMKRLELSSIWALLAVFEDPLPLPVPFEGAFVKGIESVSWMANNTKKFKSGGPDCWTFFSTASFAKRNKVPQENIPNVTAERVKDTMLEGVEKALGLAKNSIKKPIYSRVQLWGAALPVNSPGIPCIFDPHGRAGICGDWLLGSSLESAALSGAALANQISDYFQSGGERPDEFAVGLDQEFHTLKGHDIGQFPGFDSIQEPQLQPLQLTV